MRIDMEKSDEYLGVSLGAGQPLNGEPPKEDEYQFTNEGRKEMMP